VTDVYRLVRQARAEETLSGEAARLYGGRWNPRGVAVVYASASRALAVLEAFVHLTLEARSMRFALCTLALPRGASVERRARERPPRSLAASQEVGRSWADRGTTLALAVPSIIVPQEQNYVLSVRHRQFGGVRVTASEPFSFDERLWRAEPTRSRS